MEDCDIMLTHTGMLKLIMGVLCFDRTALNLVKIVLFHVTQNTEIIVTKICVNLRFDVTKRKQKELLQVWQEWRSRRESLPPSRLGSKTPLPW